MAHAMVAPAREEKNQTMSTKSFALVVVFSVLCGSCASSLFPKKVECCERTAKCCYGQMCCLPRYAKASGHEPKAFTPEAPVVYGAAQDLEPRPGEAIVKPGLLARLFPFLREDEPQPPKGGQKPPTEQPPEDKGFFSRLWPF